MTMIIGITFAVIFTIAVSILLRYLRRGAIDGGHTQYLVSLGVLMFGGGGAQMSRLVAPDFQPPWVSVTFLSIMLFGALATFATSSPSWLGLALDEFLMVTSLTTLLCASGVLVLGEPPGSRVTYETLFAAVTALTSLLLIRMAASRWQLARLEAGLLHAWAGVLIVVNLCVVLWAVTENLNWFRAGQAVLLVGVVDLAIYLVVRSRNKYYTPVRLAHRPRPAATHFFIGLLAMLVIVFGVQRQPDVVNLITVISGIAFVITMTTRQIVTLYEYELLTKRVERREKHYRSLVQDSSDVVMICSATDYTVQYVSPAYQRVIGIVADPRRGSLLADLLASPHKSVTAAFTDLAEGNTSAWFDSEVGERTFETVLTPFDGQVLATARDVTERDEMRRELHQLAYVDGLTGLSNRHRITEVLAEDSAEVSRSVIFIDLDRFKEVNDTGGHEAGDEVLVEVSLRLRRVLGSSPGELGRLGGDEFVLVLTEQNPAEVERLAHACSAVLQDPFRAGGQWYQLGGSVGVAHAGCGELASDVLHQADLAMYEAKKSSKSVVICRSQTAQIPGQSSFCGQSVGEVAQGVVDSQQVDFAVQPIVSLGTLEVFATEAFLRAQASDGQHFPPEDVLAAAHRAGFDAEFSHIIVQQALTWQSTTGRRPLIAVNMTTEEILAPEFVGHVAQTLTDTGCAPEAVLVEVSESPAGVTFYDVMPIFDQLRALGIVVVADNIGVGAGSWRELIQVPVAGFKLNRKIVHETPDSQAARLLIESVTSAAADAGQFVVATGVQSETQHDIVTSLGVPLAQGYWYAEPALSALCGLGDQVSCWPVRLGAVG